MFLKPWKIWVSSIVAFIVIVAGVVIFALYRNFNSEWSYQHQAAQTALNDSPVNKITGHSVFTDVVSEEVFTGTDTFGRQWYAFVSGPPWTTRAILQQQVVPKAQIQKLAEKQSFRPVTITLGYLTANEQIRFSLTDNVVWEVYGQNDQGNYGYLYFDGRSGKEVWKYML